LSQLISARSKKGINKLAGTPDHDDFIKVKNKINNLIENDNIQFIIESNYVCHS